MNGQRLRSSLCFLVGVVVAANAVATTYRHRSGKAAYRRYLGPDFVDGVSRVEAKLLPLRPRLSSREWVQYVSSPPNDELFEVQYAVAPTVVHWRRRPDSPSTEVGEKTFVLANFPSPAALDQFLEKQPHELRWRRDGLALIRQR